jgi:Protein of unknown function (DUF4012)
MTVPSPDDSGPGRSPAALIGAAALLVTLAGVLLWVAFLTAPVRLVTGVVDAADGLRRAERALAQGLVKAARYDTLASSAAVTRARAGLDHPSPLLALARMHSRVEAAYEEVGNVVSALEHSAAAAQGTLTIAQDALRGPNKIVVPGSKARDTGSRVRIARIRAVARLLAGVRRELRDAASELRAVRVAALPRRAGPQITRALARAEESDALLGDALAGFRILPAVLGADGPRRYLVGIQNSAELRGTGGAMLRFAVISADRGRLDLEPDQSVYDFDVDRRPIDIPLPPDAWYVAGIDDAQRFGNANWSPDWPLSTGLTLDYLRASAARLDSSAQVGRIDGFFGVDPIVMKQVLPGAGGYKTQRSRVNAAAVVNLVLNRAYAANPTGARRIFLRALVRDFYRKLLKPERPPELLEGFGRALGTKHMQVWMRAAAEQAFMERMNWDGAIDVPEGGGYAYLVQQNVGGNKLDFFAETDLSLDIAFEGRAAHVAALARVANRAFLPQPRYVLGDVGRAAATLPRGWALHRPMINLYAPATAELQGASITGTRIDHPVPAIWPGGSSPPEHDERGAAVWSATLEIPAGERGAVRFDYRQPGAIVRRGPRSVYRLELQHQPKVRPEVVTVRLLLPPGATDVAAPGWRRAGPRLTWSKALTRDEQLEVSWRS